MDESNNVVQRPSNSVLKSHVRCKFRRFPQHPFGLHCPVLRKVHQYVLPAIADRQGYAAGMVGFRTGVHALKDVELRGGGHGGLGVGHLLAGRIETGEW